MILYFHVLGKTIMGVELIRDSEIGRLYTGFSAAHPQQAIAN